jgi:hypothetical protein
MSLSSKEYSETEMPSLNEPCRLTRHTPKNHRITGSLYTCARPGRSIGRNYARISDEMVEAWILGMPSSTDEIIIVSLLGRKPNQLSEFSYYSFRGGFDRPEDRPGCPTWQEWLTERYGSKYKVCEFPTVDTELIHEHTKRRVANTILESVRSGKTVVLVDSGGVGRTGSVISTIKKMGLELSEQLMTLRCP